MNNVNLEESASSRTLFSGISKSIKIAAEKAGKLWKRIKTFFFGKIFDDEDNDDNFSYEVELDEEDLEDFDEKELSLAESSKQEDGKVFAFDLTGSNF